MRLFHRVASVLASTLLLSQLTSAHSQARNPLNYLSLIEDPRIHTPSHRVHAFSEFDLTFDIHKHSQHIRLSLEPNHDILADDAHVEYLDEFGNVRHVEKIERTDYKVFHGKSWVRQHDGSYDQVGWARIVVSRDGLDPLFEGAFTIFGDHHHIQMKSNYMQTKHEHDPMLEESDDEYMALFRDSDISRQPMSKVQRSNELSCSADRLDFNSNPNHPVYQSMLKRDDSHWGSIDLSSLLGKRQNIDGQPSGGNSGGVNLLASIGQTAGCPNTRKVALVGIATDCTYTASFNSSETVRKNVITQVNTASNLYQTTFNITLGLQNLTISDASCPGTASASVPWNIDCTTKTIVDRLNLFSQWRGARPDSNAYWSLFSTCNTGAEVGLAWLGQLCNNQATNQTDTSGNSQFVAGANVVVRTSIEWQVFAHETGHTFGAVHDCDAQTCSDGTTVNAQQCCPLSAGSCDANGQYLMNPSAVPGVTQFSPCSLGNICSALGRNSVKSTCLSDNKGVTTISGAQCGNGIVEEGEDCDCGGEAGCGTNTCCDPNTCKFNSGAVCDPSNEGCCTTSCQFAGVGSICRASTGSCDPAETCAGNNGTCPADVKAKDGTACGQSGEGLECASGQCTSRDLQCKTLMGSYVSGNDTYACNSQTCTLSCGSPEFGANVCYSMQQNFLDGTPCSGGGHCSNGVCDGTSVIGEVGSWIRDNKTLVIALASSIGGILLLAILSCIWRRCRRPRKTANGRHRRPRRGVRGDTVPGPRSGGGRHYPGYHTGGWDGPMPSSEMQQRGYGQSNMYNPEWQPTHNGGWYAQQPPPMLHTNSGGSRGQSVRYA